MMKLNKRYVGVAGCLLMTGMLMAPMDSDARSRATARSTTNSGQAGLSTIVASLPMQDLSAEEELGLTQMREEEKLARDVYQVLYAKWGLQTFSSIAQSEQRHMDSIKAVLDKYSMPDPVTDCSVGAFTDPELQELYDALVAQGEQSLVDALQVGATIEDLDIKDLYDLLEETDNADIKVVYENLAKGSRNHMRSFTYQLSLNGAEYEAQFLTAEEIEDIITSPRERGQVDENGEEVTSGSGGSSRSVGKGRSRGRSAGKGRRR